MKARVAASLLVLALGFVADQAQAANTWTALADTAPRSGLRPDPGLRTKPRLSGTATPIVRVPAY